MKLDNPLPKNAKRTFQGQNFSVYEWPQKMFDGSTKTFERAIQMSGVSVFAAVKNKVILLKQQQPSTPWYYGIPGGAMDNPKETPRQTALRELLEETGYKPEKLVLWEVAEKVGRLWHTRYIFMAQNCRKVAEQSLDNGEKIKILLVTFDQLLKFTDHRQFFKGDIYMHLLRARVDKKYKNSLKQALFGTKRRKTR
jgi:ADP-ribose pyrophosphatase